MTTMDTLDCPERNEEDLAYLIAQRKTFHVVTLVVAVLGILGNFISMWVLIKGFKPRRTFHNLLICLAVADASYLFFERLKVSRWQTLLMLHPYLFFPALKFFFRMSIFLTMALAFERYKAVSQVSIFQRKGRWNNLWCYLAIIILVALILTIPNFFDMTILENELGMLKLAPTEFRNHPQITFHRTWVVVFLTAFVPIVVLTVLNVLIYWKVRQINHDMTEANETPQVSKRRGDEAKLAVLLLTIVILFLVCNTPRLILNVFEVIRLETHAECFKAGLRVYPPVWALTVMHIRDLLLVINSSVNILIYTAVNKEFRDCFKMVVLCRTDDKSNDGMEMEEDFETRLQ